MRFLFKCIFLHATSRNNELTDAFWKLGSCIYEIFAFNFRKSEIYGNFMKIPERVPFFSAPPLPRELCFYWLNIILMHVFWNILRSIGLDYWGSRVGSVWISDTSCSFWAHQNLDCWNNSPWGYQAAVMRIIENL